ncbi:1653_t:CDS:2 [Funneliformis mosseae]|uniref:1653_t:CDS:1 n=1 Tax=Funneliformis mosseae TaxID=27381 RepID=A0A9N9ASU7_FUNMO|nr:1653_t:CDS:2 [Funneliformis mosseae]
MEKDSQIETCFKGMNLCITALGEICLINCWPYTPEPCYSKVSYGLMNRYDGLDYNHYHEGQYANGTTESVTFSQVNTQHDYIGYGYDALVKI